MTAFRNSAARQRASGFTLIELSIVLVIIGLIVGGVLTGRDLIRAAEVRAQISQIEKYNTAVNTFYGKYGALPGDLNGQVASAFGFTPRGQYAGQGDGNGVIEGVNQNGPGGNFGYMDGAGETVMFWVDLSTANGLNVNLIEGSFSAASPTTPVIITGAAINTYFPQAKIGGGNSIYVFSGSAFANDQQNYFGLSLITGVTNAGGCQYCLDSGPGLTVMQAYNIDKKLDDGLPTSGNVIAQMVNEYPSFPVYGPSGSASTCFDAASGPYLYSVTQNSGNGVNCVLSFQFR